jgi:hypothetical protein
MFLASHAGQIEASAHSSSTPIDPGRSQATSGQKCLTPRVASHVRSHPAGQIGNLTFDVEKL